MRVVAGGRARALRTAMALDAVRIAIGELKNPWRAAVALRRLERLVSSLREPGLPARCALAGGRCYTHLHAPGWPSRAFTRHLRAELALLGAAAAPADAAAPPARLQAVVLAITRRCPLRCEHCCEKCAPDGPEPLSAAELSRIVGRFHDLGVTQIHISGGEPLCRLADLEQLARRWSPVIDFWLFTSGVGLDATVAGRLRRAGVRGIDLSLDHWRAAEHDAFRGVPGTWAAAVRAARATRTAGLALGVTVCATRRFATRGNLLRYVAMAGRLGAGFVQILEPQAVGRYEGRDVALTAAETVTLETAVTELNRDPRRATGPLVVYPAGDQRRLGCLGAGRRYLYVDPDGRVHPCPFCRGAVGSALTDDLAACLESLRRHGCAQRAPGPEPVGLEAAAGALTPTPAFAAAPTSTHPGEL